MELLCEDAVVVGLTPVAARGTPAGPGIEYDVIVALLVIAEVVLAAAEDHHVPDIVVELRAVVMVDRPHAVVAVKH